MRKPWPEAKVLALDDVERACDNVIRSWAEREEAIVRAHLAGNSLRQIASQAGISHEGVRKIIERHINREAV